MPTRSSSTTSPSSTRSATRARRAPPRLSSCTASEARRTRGGRSSPPAKPGAVRRSPTTSAAPGEARGRPGPYSVELWAGPRADARRPRRRSRDPGRPLGGLHGRRAGLRSVWAIGSGPGDGGRCAALASRGGARVRASGSKLAREGRMERSPTPSRRRASASSCGTPTLRCLVLFRELIASNDPQRIRRMVGGHRRRRDDRPRPGRAVRHSPSAASSTRWRRPPSPRRSPPACPNGRTAVVEGAAHWCQLEAPAARERRS